MNGEMQSSYNVKDKIVLELMDSTDSYLHLMNSLSSSLREVSTSFFIPLLFFFNKKHLISTLDGY